MMVFTLQWSHGFSAMERVQSKMRFALMTRFNGAMAFQPWKVLTIMCNVQTKTSFNGAMAFQPWKGVLGNALAQRSLDASMEPWLFSHGKN